MNLNLPLTYHWYDETLHGRKRVEYRSQITVDPKTGKVKPSQNVARIWNRRHKIKTVRFSRGYTATTMGFNVVKIDKGPCPLKDFGTHGEEYIRIHFTS